MGSMENLGWVILALVIMGVAFGAGVATFIAWLM